VETAHTDDYDEFRQEYGGLSLLSEEERQTIVDMVFGDDGLQPGIVKMFLGSLHQREAGGPYNHRRTTKWMRYFVTEGLEHTRRRGDRLRVITTLYGPPGYATEQGFVRGRDLDPDQKRDVARYVIDWVQFLRREENIPVQYVSLHNEGEDWTRWPSDGESRGWMGHDYNLYWPPEQVVEFLRFMRPMMDKAGLEDVGLSPGETTNWTRFHEWGYAHAIASDEQALQNLGLITSHGFFEGEYGEWYGDHRSVGIDMIRDRRPEMHAWVTSTSWGEMTADFVREIYGNIYSAKVNAITPWAVIQRPEHWPEGDPNPGTAFKVSEDGRYEVLRGYYFYKQVTRAGQPGMAVARTYSMDSRVSMIGYAGNGTDNPNAFVVINIGEENRTLEVTVEGHEGGDTFRAVRTTNDESDTYSPIGTYTLNESDELTYEVPAGSVTTFFAQ
jgi:hypothetical protein